MFVSHPPGWGLNSRLHPACMELACSPLAYKEQNLYTCVINTCLYKHLKNHHSFTHKCTYCICLLLLGKRFKFKLIICTSKSCCCCFQRLVLSVLLTKTNKNIGFIFMKINVEKIYKYFFIICLYTRCQFVGYTSLFTNKW